MPYVSTLSADVTNKKPGDPIRSADWNALASEVVNLSENKLDRADNALQGDLNVPGSLAVAGSAALHQGLKITGGPIDFGDYTGPLVGAWGAAYGMGMQSNNLYFRTGSTYAWFRHGKHSEGQQDAGEGGKVMMTLDNNGLILTDGLKVGKAATFAQGLTVSGGGTTMSEGALSFGKRTGQHINLWGTEYGLGIQSNTLYFRTANTFAWHQNGKHVDDVADPGGGVALMTLNQNNGLSLAGELGVGGALSFGERLGQHINFWKTNYGIGIQPNVMYFRSDTSFCWYRGGSHVDGDSAGPYGFRTMLLDKDGMLHIAGSLFQRSDERVKLNPTPVAPGDSLQRLMELTVYEYEYQPGFQPSLVGQKHHGFLAQDVEKSIPEAVTVTNDLHLADGQVIEGARSVAYDRIFTETVGAIQALHQRLQAQEARIQQLVVQLAAADATAAQA